MARCSIQLPDKFLDKLRYTTEHEPEIAEKALNAGGEIVLAKVQSNLAASLGRGLKRKSRSTGQLAAQIGLSKVRVDRDGNHNIKIGFDEARDDGKSNAMLANVLEYGKHGQPPKPFLQPAKRSSKAAAIQAMQEVFEREVGSL